MQLDLFQRTYEHAPSQIDVSEMGSVCGGPKQSGGCIELALAVLLFETSASARASVLSLSYCIRIYLCFLRMIRIYFQGRTYYEVCGLFLLHICVFTQRRAQCSRNVV